MHFFILFKFFSCVLSHPFFFSPLLFLSLSHPYSQFKTSFKTVTWSSGLHTFCINKSFLIPNIQRSFYFLFYFISSGQANNSHIRKQEDMYNNVHCSISNSSKILNYVVYISRRMISKPWCGHKNGIHRIQLMNESSSYNSWSWTVKASSRIYITMPFI